MRVTAEPDWLERKARASRRWMDDHPRHREDQADLDEGLTAGEAANAWNTEAESNRGSVRTEWIFRR